jgi:hypothetical protein
MATSTESMKRHAIAFAAWLLLAISAHAAPLSVPCTGTTQTAPECDPVNAANPLPVAITPYSANVVALTGNATGSTGAVVGTLAAAAGKTTYLCDFDISSAGTGSVGPITIAGLLGGSKVYQLTAPTPLTKSFNPCLPASAVNTAITITTTADASATAVDVNSSGYRQ